MAIDQATRVSPQQPGTNHLLYSISFITYHTWKNVKSKPNLSASNSWWHPGLQLSLCLPCPCTCVSCVSLHVSLQAALLLAFEPEGQSANISPLHWLILWCRGRCSPNHLHRNSCRRLRVHAGLSCDSCTRCKPSIHPNKLPAALLRWTIAQR